MYCKPFAAGLSVIVTGQEDVVIGGVFTLYEVSRIKNLLHEHIGNQKTIKVLIKISQHYNL